MTHPLVLALLLSTTAGLRLKQKLHAQTCLNTEASPCVQELSCLTSLDRLRNRQTKSVQGDQFADKSFPAGDGALFWVNYPRDDDNKMRETYAAVTSWKSPSELEGDKKPSLWGSEGV